MRRAYLWEKNMFKYLHDSEVLSVKQPNAGQVFHGINKITGDNIQHWETIKD